MRRTSRTRRTLERLFGRLSSNTYPQNRQPIVVSYPRRFARGKCIIAARVPSGHLTLRVVREKSAGGGCFDPPRIMNTKDGPCVRFIWRRPDIRPDESRRLLREAQRKAEWAEKAFGMKAIVSPIGGLVDARRKLRAS